MYRSTFLLTLVGCLLFSQIKIQAQTFDWVGSFEKNVIQGNWERSIAVDLAGDVYMIGHFSDSIDLDPGSGVYNVMAGAGHSFYVVKLDNNGQFVWGHSFGTGSFASANSIQYDGASGLYITGQFQGLIDFDPGPGTHNVFSGQNHDFFIFKMSVAGNLVWAHGIGNTGSAHAWSGYVGKDSSYYVTGTFGNEIDFDPGPDTTILQQDSGWVFVTKYDPYGELVWAKNFGLGLGSFVSPTSIAVDEDDNVIVVGELDSIADFDPGPGVYNLYGPGVASIFVLKLDPDGNFLWANAHGSGYTLYDAPSEVQTMPNNDILVTGSFSDTVDFDPGPNTLNFISNGSLDMFIQRLDPTGQLVWAKHIGGNGQEAGLGIAIEENGHILITGSFEEKVDFDPGSGTFNLTSNGGTDGFLLRLDDQGNFVTAFAQGGISSDGTQSIALSPFNEIFLCGYFDGEVDFDPGPGVTSLTAIGATYGDIFLEKFDDINIGFSEQTEIAPFHIFPNPANDRISITGLNDQKHPIQIMDATGRVVMDVHAPPFEHIDISSLSKGMYFIPVTGASFSTVLKFIKN